MKKLYAVIPCISPEIGGEVSHAVINARTAYENGANGIFLTGHNTAHHKEVHHLDMIGIYDSVRNQFPDKWIGINFLDIATENLELLNGYKASLTGLNALCVNSLPIGKTFRTEMFGTVTWTDGCITDEELEHNCKQALLCTSTVTVSGNKHGKLSALDIAKKTEAFLNGNLPVALAYEGTADTLSPLLPHVDTFLVGSTMMAQDRSRESQYYFIPNMVQKFAEIVHSCWN